jgi:hypothetical protein
LAEGFRSISYGTAKKTRYGGKTRIPSMTELLLTAGLITLLGILVWLGLDSDDDNGGGGLMQPALVPVPVRRR